MSEQLIGNYRVIRPLGEGGMGMVYAAEHKLLGRPAAIKVLLPQYTSNKQIVERFFNEAKAAADLKHAGIVEIYDFGHQDDGSAFIAMEFLEGEDLEARLRARGQLAFVQVLHFASQIASALAVAHARGVIHRDLKPANIFIVSDPQIPGGERIKLLDFGIAKVPMDESADAEALTRAGMVMGSPSYMAPEQCQGAINADARADLYSLGCIMYRMLCGRPPFTGPSSMDVMKAQMRMQPQPPRELRPDLPPELEAIVLRLMAKDPAHRYQSATELEATLKALLPASPSSPSLARAGATQGDDEPLPLWRRMVIPATVAVTLLLAAGVFLLLQAPDDSRAVARTQAATPALDSGVEPPAPRDKAEPRPALVFCAAGARDCAYPQPAEAVITWTIRSEPPRAQVWYQGKNQGETPLAIKVPRDAERTETLRLRLYDHVDRTIELTADDDHDKRVELARNVKITLFSKPQGAVIYDETSSEGIGVTPGEIGVAPGTEPIRFVLRHPGYRDEVVEVIPDRDRKKKVKLTRLVTLRIVSEPEGAEVWKDGDKLGVTPYEDEVARSRDPVVYEIRHEGYEDGRIKVRPRRDDEERIVLEPLGD